MKPASQIFQWLHAIKVDRRLNSTCSLVALQLTDKTNEREFARSGTLITWQAELTIAVAIGRCERTVRTAIKLMERHDYVLIKSGHGKGRSNQYTLTLPNRQEVAAYGGSDTGKKLPVETEGNRQLLSRQPATFEQATGKKLPPNLSKNHLSNLSAHPDTEPAARDGASPAPGGARPPPLGQYDADLRRRLGDDFKWLRTASLVGKSGGTLTLAIKTDFQGEMIRKLCQAAILEVTGASRLEFNVELPTVVDPPKARRQS